MYNNQGGGPPNQPGDRSSGIGGNGVGPPQPPISLCGYWMTDYGQWLLNQPAIQQQLLQVLLTAQEPQPPPPPPQPQIAPYLQPGGRSGGIGENGVGPPQPPISLCGYWMTDYGQWLLNQPAIQQQLLQVLLTAQAPQPPPPPPQPQIAPYLQPGGRSGGIDGNGVGPIPPPPYGNQRISYVQLEQRLLNQPAIQQQLPQVAQTAQAPQPPPPPPQPQIAPHLEAGGRSGGPIPPSPYGNQRISYVQLEQRLLNQPAIQQQLPQVAQTAHAPQPPPPPPQPQIAPHLQPGGRSGGPIPPSPYGNQRISYVQLEQRLLNQPAIQQQLPQVAQTAQAPQPPPPPPQPQIAPHLQPGGRSGGPIPPSPYGNQRISYVQLEQRLLNHPTNQQQLPQVAQTAQAPQPPPPPPLPQIAPHLQPGGRSGGIGGNSGEKRPLSSYRNQRIVKFLLEQWLLSQPLVRQFLQVMQAEQAIQPPPSPPQPQIAPHLQPGGRSGGTIPPLPSGNQRLSYDQREQWLLDQPEIQHWYRDMLAAEPSQRSPSPQQPQIALYLGQLFVRLNAQNMQGNNFSPSFNNHQPNPHVTASHPTPPPTTPSPAQQQPQQSPQPHPVPTVAASVAQKATAGMSGQPTRAPLPAVPLQRGPTPQVPQAIDYLRNVKQTFKREVDIYNKFHEIMKNFKTQRIGTPDAMKQVADLFYQYPNLVIGFNTFLPNGYRISKVEHRPGHSFAFTIPNAPLRFLSKTEERAAAENDEDREEDEDDENEEAAEGAQSTTKSTTSSTGDHTDNENPDRADAKSATESDPLDDGDDDEEVSFESAEVQSQHEKLQADTLKVMNLLKALFKSRPEKLLEFRTFIDYFIAHTKFYTRKPQLDLMAPQCQPEPWPSDKDRELEKKNYAHIIQILAVVFSGEKEIHDATIEFLPHLSRAMSLCRKRMLKKIRAILSTDGSDDTIDVDDVELDDKDKKKAAEPNANNADRRRLIEAMRQCGMAVEAIQSRGKCLSQNIAPMQDGDKTQKQQQIMARKNALEVIKKINDRPDSKQLKEFNMLIKHYLDMEFTREEFIGKIFKIDGFDVRLVERIQRILGIYTRPEEGPENDADCKVRADVTMPHNAKRRLLDQNRMHQVAPVCTLGPSYRLMKNATAKEQKCSERLELSQDLKNVINDTWMAYPTKSSKETGTQTAKKSNLEDFRLMTEDERYELDIIVDSNRTIIEDLQKTLRDYEALPEVEKQNFELSPSLNCNSEATLMRVLQKVYGNSVNEIMEAARRNPSKGIRTLLTTLLERDATWTRFQQESNRAWRNELDKQMIVAQAQLTGQQKQDEVKTFKGKQLVSAIEQLYEQRKKSGESENAHLTLEYCADPRIYQDVSIITSHFFGELPGGKTERDMTKVTLFRVLMEWVCQPPMDVEITVDSPNPSMRHLKFTGDLRNEEALTKRIDSDNRDISKRASSSAMLGEPDAKIPKLSSSFVSGFPSSFLSSSLRSSFSSGRRSTGQPTSDELTRRKAESEKICGERTTRIFYGDDNLFLTIRFHHMLCERLSKLFAAQLKLNQEHLDNEQRDNRWEQGLGAKMHGRRALDPSTYYDRVVQLLKQLPSNSPPDMPAFEDSVRTMFPGEVILCNCIDELFVLMAKGAYAATIGENGHNAVTMYLKQRRLLEQCVSAKERDEAEKEYALEVQEHLPQGKNTYRFEFNPAPDAPYCNIWVLPREPNENDEDREGKEEVEVVEAAGPGAENKEENLDEDRDALMADTDGDEQ